MAIQTTRLETDEEIHEALLKYRPARSPVAEKMREPAPADDAPPLFHPTLRPATPTLLVYDDGTDEGELIRIRQEDFTIGRSDGDLILAYDSQMSGRHAQLRSSVARNKRRWHLVDLDSTNGTYVRIRNSILEHNQEFIIGKSRFRFEHPQPDTEQTKGPADQATRAWPNDRNMGLAPAIVEVESGGAGRRLLVTEKQIWFGKDANYCQFVLDHDRFASARHARIRRDGHGRWVLENNKSLNGVWLRIKRLSLPASCQFLLGEQQFLVRIPQRG